MNKKNNLATTDLSCLNCERPLNNTEKFCPECGQKNKGKNLKLADFMREVFAGFFSWDAKFWKTIIPLLTKPGQISKDYIEGKRIRFTNPFRFFFIITIIFFFLVKLNSAYEKSINFGEKQKSHEKNHEHEKNHKKDTDSTSFTKSTAFRKDISSFIKFQKKHPKLSIESALDSLQEEKTFMNKLFYKKAKTINDFSSDTEGSFNKLLKMGFSYLSSAFLMLLPIFALFLKLLYIRRKLNYMNHLIFITHIATFFFICLVLYELVSLIPFLEALLKSGIFLVLGFVMVFGVYPFLAMKTFYGQTNKKTFFKLFLIVNVFGILICLTIALNFILAFFMM